ncbi:putative nitrate reductase, large subunit protein [Vibrio sinaloensis DSM 21326]|uniref:Putative nitrate reductase, large subunit protein n=1 Tax=Vibrio sinaloensis DSM 21326 TaxID=945550 RepID=E8M5B0_PHOS4|nr:nitrate reductase [Vibrio sinaloensis]EGA70703.1 putative nitrate reductase, large subunit protein [Vibrio sinaloensis DSM 21326]
MAKEKTKTACPYCGVGCGVEVDQLGIVGDKQHPANHGSLCVKGSALAESLAMPSRLLYPKFQGKEIDWPQATNIIAKAYHDTINEHGPDATAMYVSGQLLTEDYYVANKFMKALVGSANIDTNSRLCMSSAVVAHNRAFGEDVVPVNYEDIDHAELIIICGANTAWTHPVLFRRIQQARERNPALKMVVIDPRETVTAQQADLHLAINNDGDIALFNGLLRYCLDMGFVDESYIDKHTLGLAELAKEVFLEQYSISQLSDTLAVSQEQLVTFYRWFTNSKRAVTLFCQGVNQSQQGADKGNAIINVHLATGKIGYKGAGPFSITGQPNAMGGREVGGLANQLAVHRGFDDESIALVSDFWQTSNLARKPGLKAVDMFEAVASGKIKVIWIMATNPVVSMPDNHYVKQALKKCPLVIVSDVTADADIAKYADLLLPAAGWGEKQGMVTNSERILTRQRKFIDAKGAIKPDWQIIAEAGEKLSELKNVTNGFAFNSEADVFREYAAMTAINEQSSLLFNLSQYANITNEEYHNWQPTRWGEEHPYANGVFSHRDGKARFIVTKASTDHSSSEWWLNSGRQRDQWHTMTRTGHISHLAATEPEPMVYLNSRSAAFLDISAGDLVTLSKDQHRIHVKASIDDGLSNKQLYMSMHWAGHYAMGSEVNSVLSRRVDPFSGQPAFKSQSVHIEPTKPKTYGIYVGERFEHDDFIYRSFQTEQRVGIWRFASLLSVEKRQARELDTTGAQRQVLLDVAGGWVAVGYDEAGEDKIVRSLLLVSQRPVCVDSAQLSAQVGKPLTFSALLNLVSEQQSSELICSCFRVNEKQIQTALETGQCSNLSQVKSKLKCGTNCGSCLPQVERIVTQRQSIAIVNK